MMRLNGRKKKCTEKISQIAMDTGHLYLKDVIKIIPKHIFLPHLKHQKSEHFVSKNSKLVFSG